jgi:hypothetical protein
MLGSVNPRDGAATLFGKRISNSPVRNSRCGIAERSSDVGNPPTGGAWSACRRRAGVIYLSLATLFAAVYGLIWELIMSPDAFVNLVAPEGGPKEVAVVLYFSLTTLTTTGYGDIVGELERPAEFGRHPSARR